MSLTFTGLQCCGVKEINGLSSFATPEEVLKNFAKCTYLKTDTSMRYDSHGRQLGPTNTPTPFERFRFVIFSQARKNATYGMNFASFIKNNGLGEVRSTRFHMNPNSGNLIKVFIWTVDHTAIREWLTRQGIQVPPPQEPAPVVPEV